MPDYVRDPAGNMVEVNWPDVSTLDRSVIGDIENIRRLLFGLREPV